MSCGLTFAPGSPGGPGGPGIGYRKIFCQIKEESKKLILFFSLTPPITRPTSPGGPLGPPGSKDKKELCYSYSKKSSSTVIIYFNYMTINYKFTMIL